MAEKVRNGPRARNVEAVPARPRNSEGQSLVDETVVNLPDIVEWVRVFPDKEIARDWDNHTRKQPQSD